MAQITRAEPARASALPISLNELVHTVMLQLAPPGARKKGFVEIRLPGVEIVGQGGAEPRRGQVQHAFPRAVAMAALAEYPETAAGGVQIGDPQSADLTRAQAGAAEHFEQGYVAVQEQEMLLLP